MSRIAIDGLWRCLCPSFDVTITQLSRREALKGTRRVGLASTAVYTRSKRRVVHTEARTESRWSRLENGVAGKKLDDIRASDRKGNGVEEVVKLEEVENPTTTYEKPSNNDTLGNDNNEEDDPMSSIYPEGSASGISFGPDLRTRKPHITPQSLARYDIIPTTHLHERLRHLRTQEGAYAEIAELVDYLITERGETPALIHYDALIKANADAVSGSVDAIKSLLYDMKQREVELDSGAYHGVLQVLAIHPDYILREEIMQQMRERWHGLSPDGWHYYIVGLLRERLLEQAIDKLEQMLVDGIYVQPWLYDIFTYQLCEAGELDEAFRLTMIRFDNIKARQQIQPMVWYYLLDVFSHAFHHKGTSFIWKYRISTSMLTPSDGILVAVLNLAARYADPALATSCIRILSTRRTSLSSYHYEALLQAYVGSKDLKTSFRILTIMTKAGLSLTSATTRPLFAYLSQAPKIAWDAWDALWDLHADGHSIPVSAVNVVLEAVNFHDYVKEAIEMYKQMHNICEAGPNTETFNILLRPRDRDSYRKDDAMFLAAEMRELNVRPDILTYDRLILICGADNDFEDAFKYLEEMIAVGTTRGEDWWLRRGTAGMLARRAASKGDERTWAILEEMETRGMKPALVSQWCEAHWGESKDEVDDEPGGFQERLRSWKNAA